jgi:hypothetical protein
MDVHLFCIGHGTRRWQVVFDEHDEDVADIDE